MLWVLLSILVGLLWVHFLEGEGSGAIVALTATLFSTALGSSWTQVVRRMARSAAFLSDQLAYANPTAWAGRSCCYGAISR